jgi:hypothetical protein
MRVRVVYNAKYSHTNQKVHMRAINCVLRDSAAPGTLRKALHKHIRVITTVR